MRTNIAIDDALMADAMEATGLPTKRAVVEEALRLCVRIQAQLALLELVDPDMFWPGYDPEEGDDDIPDEWTR